MSLSLYYHTIKYLKPRQILARVRRRFSRPKPDLGPPPPQRKPAGRWTTPVTRAESMLSPTRFRFLNMEEDIQIPGDWNSPELDRLWLYNLHYFDFLNSSPVPDGAGLIMDRWTAENPPGNGVGWEPYPLSLRIVNWVKYLLGPAVQRTGLLQVADLPQADLRPEGLRFKEKLFHSLAVQARFLSDRIEYHLLANHLFANAKALVFAGLFFEGREAAEWLTTGLSIIDAELDEQILADGGHFERSPMYHSIILEDLLDLVNLDAAYPCLIDPALTARCRETAARMLGWLRVMTHPDGRIALFNDATFEGAPAPAELTAYAGRLNIRKPGKNAEPLVRLPDSGYLRAIAGPLTLFVDAAPLGPDYQPGHGHADTLSFELSCGDERLIVDSGTSTYTEGAERLLERSTDAHNTLQIDRKNSSEIWKSFRVARRAGVTECTVKQGANGEVSITAAHDGYRRPAAFTTADGIGIHRREFVLSDHDLEIKDSMLGKRRVFLKLVFHFHPGIVLEKSGNHVVDVLGKGRRLIASCELDHAFMVKTESFDYHPLFGLSLPSYRIVCATEAKLPQMFSTTISLAEKAKQGGTC